MKLYTTPKGRWAGTQADAKAIGKEDGGWSEAEVPTDKPGLLAFLNEHLVGGLPLTTTEVDARRTIAAAEEVFAGPGEDHPKVTAALKNPTYHDPNKASLETSRVFDAKLRDDLAVEEQIANADYARLGSLAQHVAWRFEELAKKAKAKPIPSVFDTPEVDAESEDDDPLLA